MKLSEQLREQFTKFDHATPHMDGTLSASNENGEIRYELDACENIACGVRKMRLRSSRLEQLEPSQIREVCDEVAERVNYLLEPLSLIESDHAGEAWQIRSQTPSRDADAVRYYEMVVSPGEVDFCRYEKAGQSDREVVPSELTREVMIRLTDDLENAISAPR